MSRGADQTQVVRCVVARMDSGLYPERRAVYFERFESPWNQHTADERK